MAVYKRTYKAYRGPRTPVWSRFAVLSRYGFATLFQSRLLTAYAVLCMAPFLVGLAFIYIVNSSSVQALLHMQLGRTTLIDHTVFYEFLVAEAWMGFILTAWATPGMVSKDFANHAVQLYLSRPLSRTEYVAGKIVVLATLLSCTTWVPMLILFLVQAQLKGHGWGWDNLWLAGSIMAAGILWIAVISVVCMALAVWVRWRLAATALMLGMFFVLPGIGGIMNLILRTRWGSLFSLPYVITLVWRQLFRMPMSYRGGGLEHFGVVPFWSAWASLLFECLVGLWMIHRRLRAREVERA